MRIRRRGTTCGATEQADERMYPPPGMPISRRWRTARSNVSSSARSISLTASRLPLKKKRSPKSALAFDSSTVPVLQEVLQFTQARHEVLAGNVANIDTPGYRTRDLNVNEFQEKLREAIQERNTTPEHALSPGLTRSRDGDPLREVRESLNSILRHDDANVSLEQQVTQISKNQFMHNLAISIMTSQFRLLESAIREQV